MLEKLRDTFRCTRGLEIIILIIILSIAGLCIVGTDFASENRPETILEERLRGILSYIDGVSDVQVMISGDEEAVSGVVIIASGVSDMRTQINIQNAVRTLLNTDLSKIEIINRG